MEDQNRGVLQLVSVTPMCRNLVQVQQIHQQDNTMTLTLGHVHALHRL